MAADNTTVIALVIGGGGIVASVLSLFRFPTDRNKIIVDTAQGAVVVAKEIRDQLVAENKRLKEKCEEHEQTLESKDRVIASLEHIITIIDDRHSERETKQLILPPPSDKGDR